MRFFFWWLRRGKPQQQQPAQLRQQAIRMAPGRQPTPRVDPRPLRMSAPKQPAKITPITDAPSARAGNRKWDEAARSRLREWQIEQGIWGADEGPEPGDETA